MTDSSQPLDDMDHWEEFLKERYPESGAGVGDTFPVGCAYSDRIVFHEFFALNPDSGHPAYQTELGIYEMNCGLDRVDLSWDHDEYLYQSEPYLTATGNDSLTVAGCRLNVAVEFSHESLQPGIPAI